MTLIIIMTIIIKNVLKFTMKKIFIFILCFVAVASATAQTQKANYDLALKFENEIEKLKINLNPSVYFINNTDSFWYNHKTSDGVKYYIVNPTKKSKKELFDVKELLSKISVFTREVHNPGKFSLYSIKFDKKKPIISFEYDGESYSYNYNTKDLEQLKKEEKNENFDEDDLNNISAYVMSPDSLYFVFVKDHNLYLIGNKKKGMDSTEVQITKDGSKYHSYAKYPNEDSDILGPNGRWLKNSKKFLITMEDMSKCDLMHVIDHVSGKRPKLHSYKYCCPGDENIGLYTLHLLDVKSRKITDIKADKWKDQYVEYAYDSKDGDRLYLYRTKRTWNEKELCIYYPKTGELKPLFNEVDKPFFDYVIAQTHFINDGKEIIYRSERTGYGHFYLYDGITGKLKRSITSGAYVTGQVVKIDTLKRDVYFYAFGREKNVDPYYYMLYKANLDKGGVKLLTSENANHKVTLSKSSRIIIDNYSRVDMEPMTSVRNNNGKIIMNLEKPDLKALYDKGWKKPERFTVKAADGITDLYGVMWKPIDFDSTKTYPIISEVYPGPQYEYVPTSFCIQSSFASKLAQLGFIVIQVGHRGGTPMRGKFYHRQSYKNMRSYALADDKAAITELARRYDFINLKKVGIFGHSGGGAMSTTALCTYPEFYTVAVSSAGNHDNTIYNTGWIEMNNGIKEVIKVKKDTVTGKDMENVSFKLNPIHTNMQLAKNYDGHLLLVHGLMDTNVNPAHSIRMAKALIKEGKNFDMILLPESTHGFRAGEDTYFERKMWRYFAKYLLNDASGDYQSEISSFNRKTK